MASRYHSDFPEKKITSTGAGPEPRGGMGKRGGPERTASWPTFGPTRKGSFNAKTKAAVVKTHPARHGVN